MFKTGSYCVYYDEIKNTIECCENINTKQDTIMIIVVNSSQFTIFAEIVQGFILKTSLLKAGFSLKKC